MSKLQLSLSQRNKARDLLQKVESGELSSPQDIVGWTVGPSVPEINEEVDYEVFDDPPEPEKKFVDVSTIRGVTGPSSSGSVQGREEQLKNGRLSDVLNMMLEGEFELRYDRAPPKYLQYKGELYVSSDGRHRSIACKSVGVDELWGEVTTYEQ